MLTSKNHLSVVFCRVLVFILCMSLASGCTTFKSLAPADAQSAQSLIKPGDEIRLTTKDGKVREFTLKEVTARQLVGQNESVNLTEISKIERREFSTGKTVTLAIASVIILGMLTASSSGGWSQGP